VGGVLIAIKDSLRPTFISLSISNVEQLFIRISPQQGHSVLVSVVYIPTSVDLTVYESYSKSVKLAWESANYEVELFFGDINLPRISWYSLKDKLAFFGPGYNKA